MNSRSMRLNDLKSDKEPCKKKESQVHHDAICQHAVLMAVVLMAVRIRGWFVHEETHHLLVQSTIRSFQMLLEYGPCFWSLL